MCVFLLCCFKPTKGFPGGSAGKESECNMGDLGWEDPLEKGMATHSSILAWRICMGCEVKSESCSVVSDSETP